VSDVRCTVPGGVTVVSGLVGAVVPSVTPPPQAENATAKSAAANTSKTTRD
jgi:hypothetical protein